MMCLLSAWAACSGRLAAGCLGLLCVLVPAHLPKRLRANLPAVFVTLFLLLTCPLSHPARHMRSASQGLSRIPLHVHLTSAPTHAIAGGPHMLFVAGVEGAV